MTVKITVKEVGPRDERTLEVRRVTTDSHKRLTAHSATKLLRRQFPELPANRVRVKVRQCQRRIFRDALGAAV